MDAPPISPDETPTPGPGTGPPPTGPSAPEPRRSPRRLHRSADDRVLGGVAGGIADHFDIDPLFVRLGFVLTAFFGGIGVVAYLVAWVVLPVAPATSALPTGALPSDARPPRRVDVRQLLGFGLVALGLAVIPGSFGLGFRGAGAFWPLALIAIGVGVLWLRTGEPSDPPTEPGVPPVPIVDAPDASDVTVPNPVPVAGAAPPLAPSPTEAAPRPDRPPRPPKPPKPKSNLGAITASALLVLAGGAWLLDLSGAVDVDLGTVFALALAVVGIALVTSAWYGRAHGLIALGIPLALIVGAFGVIDVPVRGGIGDVTHRPHTIAAVDSSYELAIGSLVVDLRDVDFSARSREVRATLGIGELDVYVPDDVRVVLDGHAGAGSVHAFGRDSNQCCPTDVARTRPGLPGAGTLHLVAEVGVGDVAVSSADALVTVRDRIRAPKQEEMLDVPS